MGEVDLGLVTGRGLEAPFEQRRDDGPELAQEIGDGGVAAGEAAVAELTVEAAAGQLREGATRWRR
jgi:hypothetical protein